MKKGTTFYGNTIGLFLKSEHGKWIDLISNELKEEGANVVIFRDEKELTKLLWEDLPKSAVRPGTIIFDADITNDKLVEYMLDLKIDPISVLIRSKELPTVSVEKDKETTLSLAIKSIFNSKKYRLKEMQEKVEEKV